MPAFAHRYGIDLVLTAVLPQIGRPLPALWERQLAERRTTGTAVYYPPTLGRLQAFEDFHGDDWVVTFMPLRKVGAVLTRPVSVGQGVAEVTVCGANASIVRARLDAVQRQLRLTIDPDRTTTPAAA